MIKILQRRMQIQQLLFVCLLIITLLPYITKTKKKNQILNEQMYTPRL